MGVLIVQSVCVFCGSSPGLDPAFAASAAEVGRLLAGSGRALVYGGGHVGLMGIVADAALGAGGRVIGVIPQSLMDREVGHLGLTELHIVGSMHERKARMAELSEGFLALPGGIGTLEEFFETWTWAQLGLHAKAFGLLDVAGFYGSLLTFLDQLVEQRFVRAEHRSMLLVGREPGPLLSLMAEHRPPSLPKWIDRSST
jgi:uncharacterized protein (TIGR00730 family)